MLTPRLQALFAAQSAVLDHIAAQDPDGFVRGQAERVLEDADGLPIAGREKIAQDSGRSVLKLKNLVVELRFAILFAKLGARVRILRDGEFGPGRVYTPDLHLVFEDGLEVLVDVVCLSYGDPDIYTPLQRAIDRGALPLRITPVVGEHLSIAQISGLDRAASTAQAELVVEEAVAATAHVWKSGQSTGTVHVVRSQAALRSIVEGASGNRFPCPDDVPLAQGEEWMGSFTFEPVEDGPGYASGGVTSGHFYNDEGQGERLLRDLRKKAERTAHLPEKYRKTPFIVAVQNDEVELTTVTALSILTGSRCQPTGSPAIRDEWLHRTRAKYPPAATETLQSGWGSVMNAWGYGPGATSALTTFGAYLEEAWAKSLSGVLVMHHSRTRLQWLPNPFARPEIADLRLLELGLPLDALGVDLRNPSERG